MFPSTKLAADHNQPAVACSSTPFMGRVERYHYWTFRYSLDGSFQEKWVMEMSKVIKRLTRSSSSTSRSGPRGNAEAGAGMKFASMDALSELVWSPRNGLSLRCADFSFTGKAKLHSPNKLVRFSDVHIYMKEIQPRSINKPEWTLLETRSCTASFPKSQLPSLSPRKPMSTIAVYGNRRKAIVE